ncbi:MAG: Ig-like domain-containing protein [Bacteroidetes bacterium]|nr:Ig-like domain-containing protein [Bacteroidota bacterium]
MSKLPTSNRLLPIACCTLLTAYCLLTGCAHPVAPEGGPRDTQPPQLDSLHSTRNFQTRFQKQTIVLAFDEWVELRDVFTQVVISPPLEKRPEIVRKKKTIQVIFDETEKLRDSATYVINFGQAIRDLTEGNAAPLVFVFSTGDYIDSLSVEGSIADAWTGKPVDKALFMLYENQADSVVRTERPFYFALTDKDGNFKVSNVKSGSFKVAALLDQNLNYRFDNDAEQIGFLDTAFVLRGKPVMKTDSVVADSVRLDSLFPDSVATASVGPRPVSSKINLKIFQEEKPLFLRSKEVNRYGQVKLGFNQPPGEARVAFDSVGQTVFFETEKDTLRLWYHLERDTSWNVYVQRDTLTDTVLVKNGLRSGFVAAAKLEATAKPAAKPAAAPGKLTPGQPFTLTFNHPLAGFNAANIRLLEDSTKTAVQPRLRIDSIERRTLLIDHAWKEGRPYEVQLLSGSVTDMFGLTNADSIGRSFTVGLRKEFGTLTLKALSLNPEKAYVIRLLDRSEAVVQSWAVSNVDKFEAKLDLLPPAIYSVELIEDLDRNGRWTTGNYDLHRQPERFTRKALEALRANWELEAVVVPTFEQ